MKRALIVTSQLDSRHMLSLNQDSFDCVICADGGLLVAEDLGIKPDLLIGDYDSMDQPADRDVIKLPTVKDMTDSEAALDLAVSKGYTDITVLGGLGGRFDHTMGNIGMLRKYLGQIDDLRFLDGQNMVFMRAPGEYQIPRGDYKYMGLIAYESPCVNLTIRGCKYPLDSHELTNDTSLGVSNEILESEAEISFTDGVLLVILSRDRA